MSAQPPCDVLRKKQSRHPELVSGSSVVASCGKPVTLPLSQLGRVVAVARLGLTATGGGFPVKGIFRSATFKILCLFYLGFIFLPLVFSLAPTPSWELSFLRDVGLSLPRGEGNVNVYWDVARVPINRNFRPRQAGEGSGSCRRMRLTATGKGAIG